MIHPDQRYELRMLQHQDLQAETARERIAAQVIGERREHATRTSDVLGPLLHRIGTRLRQSPLLHARSLK
jgi:hypothetical protein